MANGAVEGAVVVGEYLHLHLVAGGRVAGLDSVAPDDAQLFGGSVGALRYVEGKHLRLTEAVGGVGVKGGDEVAGVVPANLHPGRSTPKRMRSGIETSASVGFVSTMASLFIRICKARDATPTAPGTLQ